MAGLTIIAIGWANKYELEDLISFTVDYDYKWRLNFCLESGIDFHHYLSDVDYDDI